MYSPRIAEDLIPLLYRAAKAKKMPMTRVVNEILRQALEEDTQKTTDQPKGG